MGMEISVSQSQSPSSPLPCLFLFSRVHVAPPRSLSGIWPPCRACVVVLLLHFLRFLHSLRDPIISSVFCAIYPTNAGVAWCSSSPKPCCTRAPDLLWNLAVVDDCKLCSTVHEAGDSLVRGQRSSTTFPPAYRYARPIRSQSTLFTLHIQSCR